MQNVRPFGPPAPVPLYLLRSVRSALCIFFYICAVSFILHSAFLHSSFPHRMSAPTARSTAVLMLAIPMPREPSLPGIKMMAGVRAS